MKNIFFKRQKKKQKKLKTYERRKYSNVIDLNLVIYIIMLNINH